MMKKSLFILASILFFSACDEQQQDISSIDPVNWKKRAISLNNSDTLVTGTTYLSVYSQIYSETEHKKRNLTATISMRNTCDTDTLFLKRAEYFDTHGESIRNYFDGVIYIAPMETVEIVIDEHNKEGGTGANFIFEWAIEPGTAEPLFEAVMISTYGQQGISFTTIGKRIK